MTQPALRYGLAVLAGVFLLVRGICLAADPARPVPVILDTDIMGDVDDVGAVAVLHTLADAGEADILAMGVCVSNPWSPLCLSSLNAYFGRPAVPLGVLKTPGANKESRYAQRIAEEKSQGGLEVDPRDGSNRWKPGTDGSRGCLVEKAPPEQVARAIEDLMLKPPAEAKPAPWIEGSTTLAVMPDTQFYAQKYPEFFEAQTKWIAENRQRRNIVYVLHLGDVTEHNVPKEWEVAKRSFHMLDGKVPYALLPGNHDYTEGRNTLLSQYFPVAEFKKWPTYGGVFQEDRLDNSFHLFRVGQCDWIAVCLEFGPRDEVLEWATKVLDKHSDRLAIIVTHAYLYNDNTRFDGKSGKKQRGIPQGSGNDGEQIWQTLVRRHANVMLVLSGHVASGGLGYRADAGDHGNIVHQVMVDYQKGKRGGSAYMRLLEFLPDGKTIQAKSYSPALDRYKTDPGNQFMFTLKAAPADHSRGGKLPALSNRETGKRP